MPAVRCCAVLSGQKDRVINVSIGKRDDTDKLDFDAGDQRPWCGVWTKY